MISDKISRLKDETASALRSKRGKDILLYLMFVCVAFVFWLFLSLDSEVQKDYEIPVQIVNMPENVTLIGNIPDRCYVTVKGKGSQLLGFTWGRKTPLKIRFDENITSDDIFSLSKLKIEGRLRDYFGQGVQIVTVKPDSLRIPFTTKPGISLPLVVDADVQTNLQFVISGPIRADVDAVKAYGLGGLPRNVIHAETDLINLSNLTDTTKIEVGLQSIPGFRLIPDKVTVTIPVEPLISKKKNVQIETVGLAEGIGLITFPSSVEVSYLVPLSKFSEDYPLKAFVDFSSIDPSASHLGVIVSSVPDYYSNIVLKPDSVDYVIERNNIER